MPREIMDHLQKYIGKSRLFVGHVTLDGFYLIPMEGFPNSRRSHVGMYAIEASMDATANGTASTADSHHARSWRQF